MMCRTNKHFEHFEIRIWAFWLIFPYGNQNIMRYLLTVRFSVLWMRCMTQLLAQFSFKIQNKTHIYANTHDTFTRNAKRQGKRNKVALKTQTHTFVHTLSAQCESFPGTVGYVASGSEPDHEWVLTLDMRIIHGWDFTPFSPRVAFLKHLS